MAHLPGERLTYTAPGDFRAPWPLRFSGKAADQVQQHLASLTLTPMEHIDMKAGSKTNSQATSLTAGTSQADGHAELVAAAALFNEVANLTDTLRTMGHLIVEVVGSSDDGGAGDAIHYGITVEQLAAQIGAIADRGARLCGVAGAVGDFEQWLLSPTAREALAKVSAGGAQAAVA